MMISNGSRGSPQHADAADHHAAAQSSAYADDFAIYLDRGWEIRMKSACRPEDYDDPEQAWEALWPMYRETTATPLCAVCGAWNARSRTNLTRARLTATAVPIQRDP
jgi:hypothetical protein